MRAVAHVLPPVFVLALFRRPQKRDQSGTGTSNVFSVTETRQYRPIR